MNGDVGAVLSAIGGRFAWRYWWPVIPWLADIAMVATFRRENVQEPAGVLFLVCLATVPLLWLWGARFAVALGHARRRVFPMLIALSVGLPMLWQVVGSISRLIVGLGDGGHSEGLFLFYGLPLVALLMLGWAVLLGFGWRGGGGCHPGLGYRGGAVLPGAVAPVRRVRVGFLHRRDLLGDPDAGRIRLGRLGRFPDRAGLSEQAGPGPHPIGCGPCVLTF